VGQDSEVFVGLDVAKARYAVAVSEDGRSGEVRYLGEIDSDPVAVRRMVARLASGMVNCISATRLDRPGMVCIANSSRWATNASWSRRRSFPSALATG
jgi:hypothetical protein